MRKLLLVAAAAVFGLSSVNAQNNEATTGGFEKGDVFISGTVGVSTSKQDELKSNQFELSPSVGYFVSENIALELGLSVGSGEDVSENKTNNFGAQIGATYFFTPANQFSFSVGAGFGYETQKVDFSSGGDSTVNAFAFVVSPGLNYFVSDSFALRTSIGALSYASAKQDFDGAEPVNQFGLNLDLSDINFGVTYKF